MSLGLIHKFYGGYTIGTAQRPEQEQNTDYPGTGEYQIQQPIKQNSYTIQKQKKVSYFDIKRLEQPEVGTYDVVHPSPQKSQSFQFRYKERKDHLKDRLGPGSYEIIKPITTNQKYSFGFRDGQQIDNKQGVFEYNPQKEKLKDQKKEQRQFRHQIFQQLIKEAKERAQKIQKNNRMAVKDKEKAIQKEEQNIRDIQQKIEMDQSYQTQDQSVCPRTREVNIDKKVNSTFGKSQRPSLGYNNSGPGPGKYNPKQLERNSDNYSFMKAEKMKQQKNQWFMDQGPAGKSQSTLIKTGLSSKMTSIKGWNEKIDKYSKEVPGPGKYLKVDQKIKQKNPYQDQIADYEKRVVKEFEGEQENPGPGKYDRHSQSPKQIYSFDKCPLSLQFQSNQYQKQLGPGKYEVQQELNKKCKVVYEQKKGIDGLEQINIGPGHYQPKYFLEKDKQQGPKFTQQQRFMDLNYKNDNVGPNSYVNNSQLMQSKCFIIGEDQNQMFKEIKEKRLQNLPGPGSYDIQSSFGYVPSYKNIVQE